MTAESQEAPDAKMMKCSYCPKEFKYNSERNRHELSHSPRFECEICCKKFSFISALRRHQKQHERTGSVKCQKCNRKFRDEVLLKRHVKYAHKGTFTCPKCSSPFSSEQALCTHMKTHKPESERRFKCSFDGCGKSFNFSHHLKHHELTHTNAKQHYCSVCGKGFIQSHHLKTHLKSHDPSEWLFCEFSGCKKKFSTEYARKRHMATHKIKPDSGISSDSNSCDASISSKEYVEDSVLCTSCGESLPLTEYSQHAAICGDISNMEYWKIGAIKQENDFMPLLSTPKPMFDKDLGVGDCKSAVGYCIMGVGNCVCAQMSKPLDENYDFTPIGNSNDIATVECNNNIDISDKYSEAVLKLFGNNENEAVLKTDDLVEESVDTMTNDKTELNRQISVVNACEGCDCESRSNLRQRSNCNKIEKDESNVEYRVDGVVRIKNTFDIGIPIKEEYNTGEKSFQFVPFSTCRDIIGNCIVGGNEGCLCARMMMDEQQAMAQEIDDITPKPKTEI